MTYIWSKIKRMKKFILLLSFSLLIGQVNAQKVEGTEIGVDVIFHASNFGGTVGIGGKYGFKFGEHIITGPSVRYQRAWSKNVLQGTKTGYNVWGGGGFIHARFFNALFVGAEFEMLKSPYQFGFLSVNGSWSPTFFIGGGFSMEFKETWRINAGMMYDVVNHQNSPLRPQYFMTNSQGALLPVIYRIAFFFPLG